MRIIAGKYKGMQLESPKGIRPTEEKVRKALFDILTNIEGLSFLELFAGSGAIGFEAISQGAGKVVFVENNPVCVSVLKKNLISLLSTSNPQFFTFYYLMPLDVSRAIKRLARDKLKFNIIFVDPPYYKSLAKKTLQMLGVYVILAPDGLVVIQHFKKDDLPSKSGCLTLFKQATYGDSVLSFYKIL